MSARQPARGPNRSTQCRVGGSGATQGWIGRVTGSLGRGITPSEWFEGIDSRAPDQLVHPGLGFGGYLNLLPEQAEDLMDARDLGEVDVGGETLLLVLRDLIGLQVVIHVGGDEIGIGRIGAHLLGTVCRRWRVTRWIRSTRSRARGLSETCLPISLTSEGGSVSSSQARRVLRVRRIP